MTRLSTIGLMLALSAPSFVFAQPDAPPAAHTEGQAEAPEEDSLAWTLAAGGVFNSGNTRSWSITAGTHLEYVSGMHGLSLDWVFAYGRAALRDATTDVFGETVDVARNSNARIRYNLFLTDDDAIFAAVAHRWDTFAGLDTRLQLQAGYLRNIFNEDDHRLWAEIGYDGTYDDFFYNVPLGMDLTEEEFAMMNNLPLTAFVHSGRLFLSYKNNLNEHVLFTTSLEALLDFENLDGNTRLNFDAGLQVTVVDSLQLGINFKLLFDQEPVINRDEVDTITTFNIIYSLI